MLCPKCGRGVEPDAVICGSCDFILDASFLGDDIMDEERATRPGKGGVPIKDNFGDALILGDGGGDLESFEAGETALVHKETTQARFYVSGASQALLAPDAIPALVPNVDPSTLRLTPFERHLLQFVDGKSPVDRLRRKSGMEDLDVKTTLATLADKGIIVTAGRALADDGPSRRSKPPASRTIRDETSGRQAVIKDKKPRESSRVGKAPTPPAGANADPPPPPPRRKKDGAPPAPSFADSSTVVPAGDRPAQAPLVLAPGHPPAPQPMLPPPVTEPEALVPRPESTRFHYDPSLVAKSVERTRVANVADLEREHLLSKGRTPPPAPPPPATAPIKGSRKPRPPPLPRDAWVPTQRVDDAAEEALARAAMQAAQEAGLVGSDGSDEEALAPAAGVPTLEHPGPPQDAPVHDEGADEDAPPPAEAAGEEKDAPRDEEESRQDEEESRQDEEEPHQDEEEPHQDEEESRQDEEDAPQDDEEPHQDDDPVDGEGGDGGAAPKDDEAPAASDDQAAVGDQAAAAPPAPDDAADSPDAAAPLDIVPPELPPMAELAVPPVEEPRGPPGRGVALLVDEAPQQVSHHLREPSLEELPADAIVDVALPRAAMAEAAAPSLLALDGSGAAKGGQPAPQPPPAAPTRSMAALEDGPERPSHEKRYKAKKIFEQALKDVASGNMSSARMNAKLATIYDPSDSRYREALAEWDRLASPDRAPAGGKAREVELFEKAQDAEAKGDFKEAVRLLEEAVKVKPDAAGLYNRLGVVLATRLKEFVRATQVLQKAIDLDPDNPTYKNNLGKVLAWEQAADEREPKKKKRGLFGGSKKEDAEVVIKTRKYRPKEF